MRRLGVLLGTVAAAGALLAGCGGGATTTVTVSSKRQAQMEHIAEMCAESRVEGVHLRGCRDYYEFRAEEQGGGK
jgi:hypothetical protein